MRTLSHILIFDLKKKLDPRKFVFFEYLYTFIKLFELGELHKKLGTRNNLLKQCLNDFLLNLIFIYNLILTKPKKMYLFWRTVNKIFFTKSLRPSGNYFLT